ncbi:MAG: hypothetical protein H6618_08615, partial [Deltaproteobacteria bacterium]|nr:hypothetical protein [Deltaproteobacteria bacterium]
MINLLKYLLFASILSPRPALSSAVNDDFTHIEFSDDEGNELLPMETWVPNFFSENYLSDYAKHHHVSSQTGPELLVSPVVAVATQTDADHFTQVSPLPISIEFGTQTDADAVLATEKTSLELIADNIAGKTRDISDPETLNRHSYALILTMYAFNDVAKEAVCSASWYAAENVAGPAARSAARSA